MRIQGNTVLVHIESAMVKKYRDYLQQQERSKNTINKYLRDLQAFIIYQGKLPLTKDSVVKWKEKLTLNYAAVSVNSMLAAINSFLEWMGYPECKVKFLKIQRQVFMKPEKELTKNEYTRLVQAARKDGKERLSLLLQTICGTGIRVSELEYITVEALYTGRAEVNCKGKQRTVFLPHSLCRILKKYTVKQKRTAGPVFITKTGNPLNRSNIWREMKAICKSAGVAPGKVFPHNLRHLFARAYYSMEKDLSRLSDILGHTNVNTTRIYIKENGMVHARQIERMGLIIT